MKMAHYKLWLTLLLIATIFGNLKSVQCAKKDASSTTSAPKSSSTASIKLSEDVSTPRSGRVMKILNDHKQGQHMNLPRSHLTQKMQSRADRLPLGPPKRLPAVYHRAATPYAIKQRPQIHRRVQNNIPTAPQRPQQQPRHNFEGPKSSRYSPLKLVPHFSGGGKGGAYRPQSFQHPNALGHAPAQAYLQAFKASPHYNGQAVVRPTGAEREHEKHLQQYKIYQQTQSQQRPPQNPQSLHNPDNYADIKQYPLPQQPQQQQQQSPQYTEQYQGQSSRAPLGPATYQQSPVAHWTYQQLQQPHYQQALNTKPYQEALLQSVPHTHINNDIHEREPTAYGRESTSQHGYAVYEDADLNEQAKFSHYAMHHEPLYQPGYHQPTSTEAAIDKEAEQYLKFMNSNDYFLPKHDPNYREMDAEKDRQTYYQHQQQEQQQQQQQHQQNQQEQQLKYSKSLETASSSYSKPIKISQFFYQDPAPQAAAVVRGSYQAGNNLFVVNSDGNKAVKHIVASPLPTHEPATTPTTVALSFAQVHYGGVRNRTPEPVRFEFTEHDAMPATHTNAPLAQLRYKAVGAPSTPSVATPTSSSGGTTTPTRIYGSGTAGSKKSVGLTSDDIEDGDDMQEASSDNYGRVPVNPTTNSPLPVEQKDTEEYCERICSNVHDDDEEIVCGSDGYMYTSESQMECYASCLHIDVTIQSKGSCNAAS